MWLRFLVFIIGILFCWNCYTLIDNNNHYETKQTYTFTPTEIVITQDSAYYSLDTLIHKEYPQDTNIPYIKEPNVIKKVDPKCSITLVNDSVGGATYLKVLVDRGGTVRKAIILKSTNPIYNKCSLEAAMQWKLSPAITKRGPVSCWVAIPFKFKNYD